MSDNLTESSPHCAVLCLQSAPHVHLYWPHVSGPSTVSLTPMYTHAQSCTHTVMDRERHTKACSCRHTYTQSIQRNSHFYPFTHIRSDSENSPCWVLNLLVLTVFKCKFNVLYFTCILFILCFILYYIDLIALVTIIFHILLTFSFLTFLCSKSND